MLQPVLNRNIVLASSADCPADNHARQLAQFLYETLWCIEEYHKSLKIHWNEYWIKIAVQLKNKS